MKQAIAHNRQQEVDVAAAFLIAFGTISLIGGLFPMFNFFVTWESGWLLIPALYGAALMVCGFSIKRGRRHAMTASMLMSVLPVVVFPVGTYLSVFLFWHLWKANSAYRHVTSTAQPEQAEAAKGPLSGA